MPQQRDALFSEWIGSVRISRWAAVCFVRGRRLAAVEARDTFNQILAKKYGIADWELRLAQTSFVERVLQYNKTLVRGCAAPPHAAPPHPALPHAAPGAAPHFG